MSKNPGSGTATNNDQRFFDYKVNLRVRSIDGIDEIRVLECFAGNGKLWDEVQRRLGKQITRYKIDVNEFPGVNYVGDSLKFLKNKDISAFNVIDLDAWGS